MSWSKVGGSFAVIFLASLVALCDGIGALPALHSLVHRPFLGQTCPCSMTGPAAAVCWMLQGECMSLLSSRQSADPGRI